MKYLGIDYGSKRIGLAVSTEGIAFPRGVLPNDANLLDSLKDIVEKERISVIVVGDTRSYGARENPISKQVDEFMAKAREFGVPVEPAFEMGSSVAVSTERGEKKDDAAAAFILQRFLDMNGGV